MKKINLKGKYYDEKGNRVICSDEIVMENVSVVFKGRDNTLIISDRRKNIKNLRIEFSAHNGVLVIGNTQSPAALRGALRIGYESLLMIGDDVTSTMPVLVCAVEQTKILIGDDCMFASENHVRTDDAHAIFDVVTGQRLNMSQDIIIGAHVWVSYASKIFGGTVIGEGSIVGLNSVVKGRYPNNVTLAGSPSKILKRNVAWERPNVGRTTPWLRTHGDQIHKTEIYWNKTDDYKEKINLGSGHNELVNLLKKYCLNSHWNSSF